MTSQQAKPRHTARAIVVHEGCVLVMERWLRDETTDGDLRHYFSIPGGKIEEGETPRAAAERELREETTVQARIDKEVATVLVVDGRIHHFFVGEYISGEPYLPSDSEEAVKNNPENRFLPRWLSLYELQADEVHPAYRHIVPLILEIAAGKIPDRPWRIDENEL